MRILILSGLLLVGGCASRVELKTNLDPQEYESCPGSGANTITGSTFGRTKGGLIRSAAGRIVHLDKATRYAAAAYTAISEKQNKSGFWEENETETVTFDPAMFKCRRHATVGLDGTFRFDNIAGGSYYLSTYISWMKDDGQWTGLWNVSFVKVYDGQPVSPVVLRGFNTR